MANGVASLGTPVATALSGVLLPVVGIPGVFTVSLVLLMMCFAYGIIVVKESVDKQPHNRKLTKTGPPSSIVHRIQDFFDMQHIRNAFRVTFKVGSKNRRLKVVLIMCMVFMVLGPTQGTYNIYVIIYIT